MIDSTQVACLACRSSVWEKQPITMPFLRLFPNIVLVFAFHLLASNGHNWKRPPPLSAYLHQFCLSVKFSASCLTPDLLLRLLFIWKEIRRCNEYSSFWYTYCTTLYAILLNGPKPLIISSIKLDEASLNGRNSTWKTLFGLLDFINPT